MTNLRAKMISGFGWVIAAMAIGRALHLLSAAVSTRILKPADFGMLAVCFAVINVLQRVTTTGLESSIIQKQDAGTAQLNTAWTYELLRNVVLFLLSFFAAPWMAGLLRAPEATPMLRVMSLSYIILGFRNMGVVHFRKSLDFKQQFRLEVVTSALAVAVTIGLVVWLRSAWAMVFSVLATGVVTVAVSYTLHPFRPRLDFSWTRARPMFGFGMFLLGNTLFQMIRDQGIVLAVGRLFSLEDLGYFNRASTFSYALFIQVISVFWRVAYPVFAKVQNDPRRLHRAWRAFTLGSLISIPLLAAGAAVLPVLVRAVLTPRWLPIVPLMQVFFLQAGMLFLCAPSEVLFQAVGRPGLGTRAEAVRTAVVVAVFAGGLAHWKLMAAPWSFCISALVTIPFVLIPAHRLLRAKGIA